MSRPRNRQPLVEILGLDPRLGTHALDEIVVPQPGHFDIEGALQPLVDQLHPVACYSPLPPDPKDVAMQCHFCFSLFVPLDDRQTTHIGLQHFRHRD